MYISICLLYNTHIHHIHKVTLFTLTLNTQYIYNTYLYNNNTEDELQIYFTFYYT